MKRALITGGNKGIGQAITEALAAQGFAPIALSKDSDTGQGDDHIEYVQFDLTNVDQIPDLATKIGPVDVLVNNAGIMNAVPFDQYPDEDRNRMLAINLLAPVALMREFGKHMQEQGSGRIINISSTAAHGGHPDLWYGVTKAGLISATQAYARLVAEQHVGVFAVAPGGIEGTELFERIPAQRKELQRASSFGQRFTTKQEVAELAAWLATDAPLALSGQTFNINNGALLRS